MGAADSVPEEGPGDVAGLFELERARLLELLGTVADDEWDAPTPCPEWTVLGLCCHLVGDDFAALSWHRDRYLGTPAPDGATEAGFIAWLDDLQVEWVRAARRISPRLAVDLLAWTGPQVADAFRREDPRSRTAQVSWASPDPVPVWLDQVREVSEHWIHRQQLLQALGRPSDLRPDVLGPVLDGLRWAYPYRLAAASAPEPGDTVTIGIEGPVEATWHLVADGPTWAFRAEPGRRRVVSLSMTTDQAWRVLSNNLPAADQRGLDVAGEEDVAAIVLRTRAIIGAPVDDS
jgi:uncharacterized protein (TIGR03083 family)